MRLIDADALKEGIQELKQSPWYNNDINPSWKQGIKDAVHVVETLCIDEEPTVDAVPIIRCKECRWGREACGNIECHVDLNIPSEYHGYDWYCPNGEREEHETD